MDKRVIYVVEDDHFQAEWILELLKKEFDSEIEIKHIATHLGFRKSFDQIAADQPACIILDVMLQWTDTEVSEEPADLNSFLSAGMDCRRMLANDERTRSTPVIIYTVLDRADIPGLTKEMHYLRKDAPDSRLIAAVKKYLG